MSKRPKNTFVSPITPEQPQVMRNVQIRRDTVQRDEDGSGSVQVVIATDSPVKRYDEDRKIVVHEILEMGGIRFRSGRNQVPIVDSHDDSSVQNILGSVRDLRVEGGELIGNAHFGRKRVAREALQDVVDGHITDFSITAIPEQADFVERGTIYRNGSGAEVEGPVSAVNGWVPINASLCATGADENSTVRRSYTHFPREIKRMDEAMKTALVEKGMPEDVEDMERALEWASRNLGPMPSEEESTERMEEESNENTERMEEEKPAEETERSMSASEKQTIERQAAEKARANAAEVRAICRQFNVEQTVTDQLVDSGASVDAARKTILETISRSGPVGQTYGGETQKPVVTASSDDKFASAVSDGLVQRAYTSAGVQRTVEKPAPGAEDFQYVGLRRLAEQFVERMGGNPNRMPTKDIALVALGNESAMSRHKIQRDAYHTTGSFANLLLDASNKTLLAGYDEAEFTWNMWARQAPAVADFKNINRIRFSEAPDLQHVPENQEYPEGKQSDEKEVYNVEKFGRIFTVTWETIVNDDLDAISRIPAMQGVAARRTQNKKVYEVLTANADLADGGALFNSTAQTTTGGHANLASANGAPSVTTLNAGFTSMRTKKGVGTDSDAILNIIPRYLIVPAALEATALELFTSTGRPDVGGSAVGNSGVQNIYGPGGRRSLSVVADPQLDANSTTAWYLAAANNQVDTVELTFLQGEESPVLDSEWNFDKDGYKYKVRQTFGVKAIDFRGLYKNAG